MCPCYKNFVALQNPEIGRHNLWAVHICKRCYHCCGNGDRVQEQFLCCIISSSGGCLFVFWFRHQFYWVNKFLISIHLAGNFMQWPLISAQEILDWGKFVWKVGYQFFCPGGGGEGWRILRVFFYLAQKLCFWTGIIFISVYVSVCLCVCVCKFLYRLSQKVFDRFWWNLAGWCILRKCRFL